LEKDKDHFQKAKRYARASLASRDKENFLKAKECLTIKIDEDKLMRLMDGLNLKNVPKAQIDLRPSILKQNTKQIKSTRSKRSAARSRNPSLTRKDDVNQASLSKSSELK